MTIKSTAWLESVEDKVCDHLREHLRTTVYTPSKLPGILKSPVQALKLRTKKVPVIIELAEESGAGTHIHAVAQQCLCKVNKSLHVIGCFQSHVNVPTLKKLVSDGRVKKVWYDRQVRTLLNIAAPAVDAPQAWDSGYKGTGIGVAVLDTGVYPHPDLTAPVNRITAFADFIKGRKKPYDDNGHGTHVAGAIAGNGKLSGGKYRGTAPRANIIGLKVLDRDGAGPTSNIIQALQWCIDNRKTYNIRIINMSLGGSATESYRNDPICRAVAKAWKSGIVVCAAAGNEGPDARTINTPGILPQIITVGAVDDKRTVTVNDDVIADFSSRGPTVDNLAKPDVTAPGVDIVSLRSPGSRIDRDNSDLRVGRNYFRLSGTSMATPVCAGVAAIIVAANPSLTPDQVKKVLVDSCYKRNNEPNTGGAGEIDAFKAAELAKRMRS